MKAKLFFYYLGGTVIWLLALAIMPAEQSSTPILVVNFVNLTVGTFIGIIAKEQLIKHPWVLLLLPLLSLVSEVLGVF